MLTIIYASQSALVLLLLSLFALARLLAVCNARDEKLSQHPHGYGTHVPIWDCLLALLIAIRRREIRSYANICVQASCPTMDGFMIESRALLECMHATHRFLPVHAHDDIQNMQGLVCIPRPSMQHNMVVSESV